MAMAFFGHMGVEWNLLKEPDEALNKLGEWVAEYKRHRAWFAIDTCVHADIADPASGRWHGQAGSFRGVLPVHATDNVPDSPCGADSRARS